MTSKKCRDCGQVKDAAEFWKRAKSPDGLSLYCRECFGLRNSKSYRERQAKQGKKTRPYRRYSAVPGGMKYCPQCKKTQPLDAFGRNRAASNGLTSYCKPCHNKVMAENKRRNHGSERSYLLKLRYGLDQAQVDQMRARQGGVCVICLSSPAKHVDHNHLTGLVRHHLCFKCNGALGQFEDDPWRLREAADYVELTGSHARMMALEYGALVIDGLARKRAMGGRRKPLKARQSARHYHLVGKYGIGAQEAAVLLRLQRGHCAICADVPGKHIDHDHKTGAVRGILCLGCNTGMGQLGDDPVALRRAADYVMGDLVQEVETANGGTRLSFTYPDVDPQAVPEGGWEAIREADGRHRKDALDCELRREDLAWLASLLDGSFLEAR
ncbi:endonuclease VII domain-containing protein [Spirillospora sp. CA-294931]|uniref:endonuclease VII domain-containing protein n=1 Tax=Spirillospora sp. CA-294931 TaxID=3240042 RepID=UPI003D8AB41F